MSEDRYTIKASPEGVTPTPIGTSFQKNRPDFDPTDIESRTTYTCSEVGTMFEVTGETVRDWIKKGELRAFKLAKGSKWRIRHADLIEFANTRYSSGTPQ